ncbi:MAG: thymidine phosphorylase, partial [Synergistes sp.]|nr:thymidine phosphorylase [Synergistes sp.]
GGASAFVFDVKCGSGTFMKDKKSAEALAQSLVKTSKRLGKRSSAIITDMEQPLGEWVGNAAEVYEAIEVLRGSGPNDTRTLCIELCAEMLVLSGVAENTESGRKAAERAIDDGAALKKFAELITAQGGDAEVTERPLEILDIAEKKFTLKSPKSGYISRLDALSIGEALRVLGGGRMKIEDKIDHSAAIHLLKKIGEKVEAGEPVMEIHCRSDKKLSEAKKYIEGSFSVSDEAEKRTLIIDKIK